MYLMRFMLNRGNNALLRYNLYHLYPQTPLGWAMNRERVSQLLQSFKFDDLFIDELGWDNVAQTQTISIKDKAYRLSAVARKRDFAVFACDTLPDYATRGKIENELSKLFRENLVIFYNPEKTEQCWLWTKREIGKPIGRRERFYRVGNEGEPILQALGGIEFTLDEEEGITLVDVTGRIRANFDMERVTKKFYEHFKKEHDTFMGFIDGIPDEDLEEWYASVMLNRLMFLYFIQNKGFLDGKKDYLQHHLKKSKGNFYTDFLLPLFFEGLSEVTKTPETRALLGDVPYLNGGIFMPHSIEERYKGKLNIADEAFKKIFSFFEGYQWHLDERPLKKDNEINPDVLGYIFEKYINQKQMGAYYTKEDITEYISKNTILPFIFDQAQKDCAIAFEGDHSIWRTLRDDPDRYFYEAVKKGSNEKLPEHIAKGVSDISQRELWNTPTPAEYGLPTEIWRETVARRQRYHEVREKITSGEVRSINDFITYNLDVRQFAQDVIENTESSDLIKAFWKGVTSVTVLDPTCGSGAFLFAALNILEPLYEACLERMRAFVADSLALSLQGQGRTKPPRYPEFEAIIAQVNEHTNEKYFVYKRIILNNLYGVDIMEEAIEICKLRLFLKLVAQEDDPKKIEPLPDIDFNIRVGNTLVGFATETEIDPPLSRGFRIYNPKEVLAQLETMTGSLRTFRELQLDGSVNAQDMKEIKKRIHTIKTAMIEALDNALMQEYGLNDLESFRRTHKPFHWYAEFYNVLANGGFDVIIGNPPYVEYSKVRKEYTILGYKTESAGNLYAFVMEQSLKLSQEKVRFGMIIPHSAFCTDRMEGVMGLFENKNISWFSSYDIRPAKLFVGVDQRLAIYLTGYSELNSKYSTRYVTTQPPQNVA